MPRVFISHSWDDSDIARKIAEFIKRDGAKFLAQREVDDNGSWFGIQAGRGGRKGGVVSGRVGDRENRSLVGIGTGR